MPVKHTSVGTALPNGLTAYNARARVKNVMPITTWWKHWQCRVFRPAPPITTLLPVQSNNAYLVHPLVLIVAPRTGVAIALRDILSSMVYVALPVPPLSILIL